MRSDKNAKAGSAPKAGARDIASDAVRTAYGLFRPLLGPRACRFHPTCSQYSFQSFRQYGLLRGALLSAARILRCHPWNRGGYDPVPTLREARLGSLFSASGHKETN
ncbi:MAG: membrane protein insertion efficiency factor YidD [Elusimicrobiales bacterium]